MHITICLLIAMLFVAPMAFAQQDPDDPGIQDSIIIGSTYVDSGVPFAGVPLYVVTDDSVMFYHMAISYASSIGGVQPRMPHTYFPPITCSDGRLDTVYSNEQYIDLTFIGDDYNDTLHQNCFINTHGTRVQIMTLAFSISRTAPPQLVVLDTTWNPRNGSIMFGLIDGTGFIPAFQRGFLAIGLGVGVENEGQTPQSFNLSQNYPNPFNPSTNISFTVKNPEEVSLIIYDLLGRRVKSLLNKPLGAGAYVIIWDGKDELGIDTPSGIYLYRLVSGAYAETKRMVLIR